VVIRTKHLLSGRYDKDDIYNFGYVEEQMLRKQATVQEAEAFKYRADINYAGHCSLTS